MADISVGGYARIKGEAPIYCVTAASDAGFLLRCTESRRERSARRDELEFASAPEHNFKLKSITWEMLVFVNAQHYRASWKEGRRSDGEDFNNFPDAMAKAKERHGLVYAVTATGRSAPFGSVEWPKWKQVWDSLPGVSNGRDPSEAGKPETQSDGAPPATRRARRRTDRRQG